MGKNKDMDQLTNLMAKALRHKIGSMVNKDEFYANKYAKDAENIMGEAEKVLLRLLYSRPSKMGGKFPPISPQTLLDYDKAKIKEQLRKKLQKELEEKDFLDNKKFGIMDIEIGKALREFELD